jgi:hypothetical protein
MIVQRAMDRTIGDAALRAARRLFLGLHDLVFARDFLEIGGAFGRVALRRIGLPAIDELQHWIVGHECPLGMTGVAIMRKSAESRGFCDLGQ